MEDSYDSYAELKTLIEGTVSLGKLLEIYIMCLKLDEDYFFDKYGSKMIRNPNVWDTLTLREMIIEELFLDSVRSQNHWLESILHILQRESNKEILDAIISNMSEVYYPVFKTIYVALVNKENIKGLPDSQIKELQKLRKSMIVRIDEIDFDYQKKICLCLEVETCFKIMQRIIVRIGRSQKRGFTMPKNSWLTIESLVKHYEDYNLTATSTIIKIATAVLKKRSEITAQ